LHGAGREHARIDDAGTDDPRVSDLARLDSDLARLGLDSQDSVSISRVSDLGRLGLDSRDSRDSVSISRDSVPISRDSFLISRVFDLARRCE